MLSYCGYDTVLSLQRITLETVERIENHMNEHKHDIMQSFDCCHEQFYKEQTLFKFLPGHCDLLLTLSRLYSNYYSRYLDRHDQQNDNNAIRNGTLNGTISEQMYESFDFTKSVENHPNLSVISK